MDADDDGEAEYAKGADDEAAEDGYADEEGVDLKAYGVEETNGETASTRPDADAPCCQPEILPVVGGSTKNEARNALNMRLPVAC